MNTPASRRVPLVAVLSAIILLLGILAGGPVAVAWWTRDRSAEGHSPSAHSRRHPGGGGDAVKEFFSKANHFRCPQQMYYSQEEVARHATEDDLWIVIDKNVLDVSSFTGQHPGGAALMEGAGGNDMATVFSQFHHPLSVTLFSSFCVGRLRE